MAFTARMLPHALSGAPHRGASLWHRRLAIIADEALSAAEVRLLFPRLERAIFVRVAGAEVGPGEEPAGGIAEAAEVRWDPAAGGFDGPAMRRLRRLDGVAVFLKPHAQCSGRMLRDLRRCSVRTVIFDEGGRWRRAGIERALAGKIRLDGLPLRRCGRAEPLLRRFSLILDRAVASVMRTVIMQGASDRDGRAEEAAIARLAAALAEIKRPNAPRKQVRRVMHFVSSLDSGGAERQVVHLAATQRQRGLEASVRTQAALAGQWAHYLPLLVEAGVEARQAGAIEAEPLERVAEAVRESAGLMRALRCLPLSIRGGVLDLFGELMLDPPDVLHCWLDEPNVLGGVAGLLAGVPRIVLSTRNVNPAHFPHLHRPWMRPWYRFLAARRRLVFAGNSLAGITDYARWLGISASRFTLLRNAVPPEAFVLPSPQRVEAVRREIGVEAFQPLVVGVMRLSIEKRPDLFLEAIRRVRLARPDCRAAIVGVGPLESEVRRLLAALRLDRAVTLLGQRRDVGAILAAADVILLTSDHEGTPNSLLEALALGRAVVATDAGGVAEVIEHEHTGLLADCGDAGALAAAVNRLLGDPALRARSGDAGRTMVRKRFALGEVVERTLAAYLG